MLTIWHAYSATYVSAEPTEGVNHSKIQQPFKALVDGTPDIINLDELKVSIDDNTYKPHFVPDGQEYLVRNVTQHQEPEPMEQYRESKQQGEERLEEIYLMNSEWSKGMAATAVDELKNAYEDAVQGKTEDSTEAMQEDEHA